MIKPYISNLIVLTYLLSACGTPGNKSEKDNREARHTVKDSPGTTDKSKAWKTYASSEFNFSFNYPRNWVVKDFSPGKHQVIVNAYPSSEQDILELPVTIHANAGLSYIGFYPLGYGTELPTGKSGPLKKGTVPFGVDNNESKSFMLDNGQTWGFFIVPSSSPAGWDNGFIFAQLAVNNFEARCFDKETGEELSMQECDPMLGDNVKRYGSINMEAKNIIQQILQSIKISSYSEDKVRENVKQQVDEMGIKVQHPNQGAVISSPLEIAGEARGNWYFEAEFTIQLVKNGKTLADTIARAQGEWMTSDFVPFKAMLFFPGVREKGKAFLVFNNSNPSGKPELDKTYKVEVVLE